MDRALDMYVREFGAELLMGEIVDAEVVEEEFSMGDEVTSDEELEELYDEKTKTAGLPSEDDGVDSSEEE